MDALRFLGFALVAMIVIAGLDYYQQDKKHEGILSAEGYIDTIRSRFSERQQEKVAEKAERERQDRWKAGAKSYIPNAPDGWSRYAIDDTDAQAVSTVLSDYGPTPLISSISNPVELARLANGGREAALRKLNETGYVFANGTEILWFDISLKPKSARNTLAGLALGRQAAFTNAMKVSEGFAVIDGVAFAEETGDLLGQPNAAEYRRITGRIGFDEEVVLRLHGKASDASIRQLLTAVDYAGLNALLAHPSPAVGQGVAVALDQQPETADRMNDLYREMQRAQDKISQDKIENLDMGAVMVNTLASSGFNTEGMLNITGGEVFENQNLMQVGYGRAQELLLQTDQQEASLDTPSETKGVIGTLLAMLPKFGATSASEEEPAPTEVRVRKGGGSSSCSSIGSSKRCSVGN
ncbi:hypothetical protein [Ruegeria sp.]|uniref:hypothetical protein n=1 Tax=Ruegeria sp. TaxID=1879320 RepID=UPI00230D51B2|nr:hypothetical protein [Ruegeria sp.]MDA7963932.1 hypothetical protein [Ruegeria sp.]